MSFLCNRGISNGDGIQTAGIVILTNGDDDRDWDNDGNNDTELRRLILNRILSLYKW